MGVCHDFTRREGAETLIWEGSYRIEEFRELLLFGECTAVPLCATCISGKVSDFPYLDLKHVF